MTTRIEKNHITTFDSESAWHVIDANGKTLGRLSTEVAILLQGKHKPTYVPYANTGDFVIVANAEKIRVSGRKLEQKTYYRHSGYHGGLREETLLEVLEKSPTRAVKQAVKGMLPKNSLGRRMLSRLKLYSGESHPHEAQINASRNLSVKVGQSKSFTETARIVRKDVVTESHTDVSESEIETGSKSKKNETKGKKSGVTKKEKISAQTDKPVVSKPKRVPAKPKNKKTTREVPEKD